MVENTQEKINEKMILAMEQLSIRLDALHKMISLLKANMDILEMEVYRK